MEHALTVQTTASVESSQGLENLVRDLNKLLFAKVCVFGLLRSVDIHQTRIIRLRDDVDLPSFGREHRVLTRVNDLAQVGARSQALRQLEQSQSNNLGV